MNTRLLAHAAAAFAGLSFSFSAVAGDWPAWGGSDPGRNMYSDAKGVPTSWDPGKFKKNSEEIDLSTTKNVKWIAKLGSQTYGNTVVGYGTVYIGTNNAGARDPRFKDDKSVLLALDEGTGEMKWQFTVPKLESGKVNDWEYLGFLSAPYVDGPTLYAVTNRCEVVALDAAGQTNGNDGPFKTEGQYMPGAAKPKVEVTAKDADILWKYDMRDELGVFPHNASNCSPLVLDGRVYVCTSNGQDWSHVTIPAPQAPSYIVLDKQTGELLGEDNVHNGPHIFHGQWTSPSAGKVDGKWQIFFGGGDGFLYGFDPVPEKTKDGGDFKMIWKFDAVLDEYKHDKNGKLIKYPAPEGPSEIIATPVYYKNKIYVAVGQDPEHGEGVGRLMCIDPKGLTGDASKTASALVWDFKEIHRSICTVAIDPATDLLFTGDYSGFVFCIDAKTGKKLWEHDMQAHIWGSPMVVDGKVFIGDEDGDVAIFAATREKKLINEINMGAPVLATPVVADGTLFINTQTHLYAISEGAKPVTPGEKPADKSAAPAGKPADKPAGSSAEKPAEKSSAQPVEKPAGKSASVPAGPQEKSGGGAAVVPTTSTSGSGLAVLVPAASVSGGEGAPRHASEGLLGRLFEPKNAILLSWIAFVAVALGLWNTRSASKSAK